MSDPFLGEIRMFGGNFAPRNWMFCDGQLVAISEFEALYSLLGTRYGGDGRTTFGLPDLRGRCPVGMGHGLSLTNRHLGDKPGYERVTMTEQNLPPHSHVVDLGLTFSVAATVQKGDVAAPESGVLLAAGLEVEASTPDKQYTMENYTAELAEGQSVTLKGDEILDPDVTIETTGGGSGHDNMMPWGCINYIICLKGEYPPRSS